MLGSVGTYVTGFSTQQHCEIRRYNTLYAESLGLQLQLLPMLAGFFTYKAGVLGRSSIALFDELSGRKK